MEKIIGYIADFYVCDDGYSKFCFDRVEEDLESLLDYVKGILQEHPYYTVDIYPRRKEKNNA